MVRERFRNSEIDLKNFITWKKLKINYKQIFWNMYDRQMASNLYTERGLSNSKKNKNHPI